MEFDIRKYYSVNELDLSPELIGKKGYFADDYKSLIKIIKSENPDFYGTLTAVHDDRYCSGYEMDDCGILWNCFYEI